MDRITKLKKYQVFIFGSNLAGNHVGGTAADAVKYFGAEMGKATGLQGQSYAIPTLGKAMKKLGVSSIKRYVVKMFDFAVKNPKMEFMVTPIGCGIAGFTPEQIAPLFRNSPSNVVLPEEFKALQVVKGFKAFEKGLICKGEQFTLGDVKELCGEIEPCRRGYHFCENPLDVLDYYNLVDSEFAEVEALGEVKVEGNKSVTDRIKIGVKLELPAFIKVAVEFLLERCFSDTKVNEGDSSKLAASGDYSKLALNGENSVGANIGIDGIAKGVKGCWITLAEYKYEDGKYFPICVKSAKIDGKNLKENVWYELEKSKFVEANN